MRTAQAAEIRCPADLKITASPGRSYATLTLTKDSVWWAQADCPVSVSRGGTRQYAIGTTPVTFKSSCGVECTANVVVADTEPPRIQCPHNGVYLKTADYGKPYADLDLEVATATDNHGLPTDDPISAVYTGSTTCQGGCAALVLTFTLPSGDRFVRLQKRKYYVGDTGTVRFTARDTTGLTQSCDMQVRILDREKPRLTCPSGLLRAEADPGRRTAKLSTLVVTDEYTAVPTPFWGGGSGLLRYFRGDQFGLKDNADPSPTITAAFVHEKTPVGPLGISFTAASVTGICLACKSDGTGDQFPACNAQPPPNGAMGALPPKLSTPPPLSLSLALSLVPCCSLCVTRSFHRSVCVAQPSRDHHCPRHRHALCEVSRAIFLPTAYLLGAPPPHLWQATVGSLATTCSSLWETLR